MTDQPNPHIQDGYSLDAQGNADYFADRTAGRITWDGLNWQLDQSPRAYGVNPNTQPPHIWRAPFGAIRDLPTYQNPLPASLTGTDRSL